MAPRVVAMRESPNTSIWLPPGIDQSCGGLPATGTVVVALGVGAGATVAGGGSLCAALCSMASSVSLRVGAVTTTRRHAATSTAAPAVAARGAQDAADPTAPSAIRPQSRNPHTRIGASTKRYDRSASAIVTMTHQIALTKCWKVPGAVRM